MLQQYSGEVKVIMSYDEVIGEILKEIKELRRVIEEIKENLEKLERNQEERIKQFLQSEEGRKLIGMIIEMI